MTIVEIAEQAGIILNKKGDKYSARCPFHQETAASFWLYPDNHFHCYGCRAHGDDVDLYARLHGISCGEAKKVVRSGYTARLDSPIKAKDTRALVESWYSRKHSEACKTKHAAAAFMEYIASKGSATPDNQSIWKLEAMRSAAEDRLNLLDSVANEPVWKTKMYKEETQCDKL